MTALGPQLSLSLGLGPDKDMPVTRLEALLRRNHLPWRMSAIQRSQGWPLTRWNIYLQVLDKELNGSTIRDQQITYSVAVATMAAANILIKRPPTVCVVGAGEYGGAIAQEIARLGGKVIGFGGSSMGAYSPDGFRARSSGFETTTRSR